MKKIASKKLFIILAPSVFVLLILGIGYTSNHVNYYDLIIGPKLQKYVSSQGFAFEYPENYEVLQDEDTSTIRLFVIPKENKKDSDNKVQAVVISSSKRDPEDKISDWIDTNSGYDKSLGIQIKKIEDQDVYFLDNGKWVIFNTLDKRRQVGIGLLGEDKKLINVQKQIINSLSFKLSTSTLILRCPDEYANDDKGSQKKMEDIDLWTKEFYDSNPDASISDWAKARYQFYEENDCVQALEGYKKAIAELDNDDTTVSNMSTDEQEVLQGITNILKKNNLIE
jgi:hypothetical protein